jgi:hypothetical protein
MGSERKNTRGKCPKITKLMRLSGKFSSSLKLSTSQLTKIIQKLKSCRRLSSRSFLMNVFLSNVTYSHLIFA